MFSPRCVGPWPHVYSRACIATLGFALALGGCAVQKSDTQLASGVGMPAGVPTKPSHFSFPDDPREPWSPNYGTRPPIENIAPAHTPAPVEAGATRIAAVDADTVIRHAVAQHEMRRP